MLLITDAVWSVSSTHLRILKLLEKQKTMNFERIKKVVNVGNLKGYIDDLIQAKFLNFRDRNYHLTYSGYDCIAINDLRKDGLEEMGEKIGVGKESDIYIGMYKGIDVVLKFHRLGRTSFKNLKNKRAYTKENLSWMELSAVSAKREFEYLNMFQELNVPEVYTFNRHVCIMKRLIDFIPLYTTKEFDYEIIYNQMIDFMVNLYERGYVHGDFNEFNCMIKGNEIVVIDFPQCVKIEDIFADKYLLRDFECIKKFFYKKFKYTSNRDIQNELEIKIIK
ncbi:RIO kinase 2 [Spraguea lophii 42_110]|uniref:non-specific serine/threonine protein kinase n=1 Tax=Spraguea lophii (strain 42_110) TaxID=1358809 RepID=S7W8K5_SPRLO|nr:RIO kinase 2 [Spraguea lophii 42_110]